MAKSYVHGNGQIAVGLDSYGQVYDLHFPYVGLENHTGGKYVHKIGIWCENRFHWLDDGTWDIKFNYYEKDRSNKKIIATNHDFKIALEFNDAVYNEKDIFLREITIKNLDSYKKAIKLYFNHQFEIYESKRGDTAYYDPENNVIIHYKGRRMFLANAHNRTDNRTFDEYSIGLLGIEGREGTYIDAEDGKLEKNPIEHGLVDSVIGLSIEIEENQEKIVDYWLCLAKLKDDLYDLNKTVIRKTPRHILDSTNDFWHAWVNKMNLDFKDLDDEIIHLYHNSIKMLRIHTDNSGAIIASTDTDLLKYGRDSYSYVWPRDGALTSVALSRAGYTEISRTFFEFCNEIITKEGYFMHKYRADKSLGSSWHPWVYKGLKELPIQLDETALVIYSLWKDFEISKAIEFYEKIYNSLILKATEFIISRIDKNTGLVLPSYDLWEEKYGISTFTSSSVYAALMSASKFARFFGKEDKAEEYMEFAEKVKKGILEELWNEEKGIFNKLVLFHDGEKLINESLDSSSLYGIFKFDVLSPNDEKVKKMKEAIDNKLKCQTEIGGIPRYEDDEYFRADNSTEGNPWIITTLWYAQLQIAQSKTLAELKQTKYYLDWVAKKCVSESGILPEQIHPHTGEQISASPLTWSHAEFTVTVLDYIHKYEELSHIEHEPN